MIYILSLLYSEIFGLNGLHQDHDAQASKIKKEEKARGIDTQKTKRLIKTLPILIVTIPLFG